MIVNLSSKTLFRQFYAVVKFEFARKLQGLEPIALVYLRLIVETDEHTSLCIAAD